ncbi:hypothetical protein Lal_00036628 [Lupinus albus]|uniref:Protein TIFY n=1 Tax=Lupinus albus TaxID=3870 RepID=A0A6A4NS96_LUPAL|nr:putative transcription factor TIFY family [Lupinus albus]KAF1892266.1 hypothetical protein Lal_00036628 [Lupinus albus]
MSTFSYANGSKKSKFSHTCNLLSQFLKDKHSSSSLGLGIMSTKMESKATNSTMDLLTNLQSSRQKDASNLELFPSFMENPCINESNLRSFTPETSQLTIFYAGKVLVIDAFPEKKATEVIELANNLASNQSSSNKNPPCATIATENLNIIKVSKTNTSQLRQVFCSNMRIPRRGSLLKFLEKRKERVIARRPYQMNNPKQEGNNAKHYSEDQYSSTSFDLNL